jgi:hypothetical protein
MTAKSAKLANDSERRKFDETGPMRSLRAKMDDALSQAECSISSETKASDETGHVDEKWFNGSVTDNVFESTHSNDSNKASENIETGDQEKGNER